MEVEWLMLADAAQVVANKLYILGGGWDKMTVHRGLPVSRHCAVAMSVKVPWNETNRKYAFEIELVHEDTRTEQPKGIAKINGQFEVGRPPGIPLGQDQRIQLALDMGLKFEAAGTYSIIARIDGDEMKRTLFNVLLPQR